LQEAWQSCMLLFLSRMALRHLCSCSSLIPSWGSSHRSLTCACTLLKPHQQHMLLSFRQPAAALPTQHPPQAHMCSTISCRGLLRVA
jgi:hypothetical protein